MRNELELIGIGYGSYKHYVDQQTIQAIKALLYHNTFCRFCYRKFTDANPEVKENTCLTCFARGHEQFTYTYTWTEDRQGDRTYRFMDTRGHIHLTSAHSSHVTESIGDTLSYHSFSWPEKITINGEDITIEKWRWHALYTDPRKYAVIATYRPSYDGKHLVFLLTKDANALYLDKRLKRARDMLAQAKAEIKSGIRGKHGESYSNRYDPTDYDVLTRLADMVSEQHDELEQRAAS